MPRPLYIVGLIVAVMLTAGCYDRKPKRSIYAPGQPHDVMASSGSRVILVDGEGETFGKLRASRDKWEVFDAERQFVGIVERDDERVRAKIGRSGEWMELKQDDDAWELPGHVRAEVLRDGWAVFDSKNELVAFFERRGSDWIQRPTFSGEPTRRATDDGVVKAGNDVLLKTSTGSAPAPILLALSNAQLESLGAVSVGALLDSKIGEERREALRQTYRQSLENRGGDAEPVDEDTEERVGE